MKVLKLKSLKCIQFHILVIIFEIGVSYVAVVIYIS